MTFCSYSIVFKFVLHSVFNPNHAYKFGHKKRGPYHHDLDEGPEKT